MDGLAHQLANVSLYDVKSSFRKAQNAVFNFSDMEAKVREATNNDPWGTPTSLMQKIADGTNNYQQFHEIMPFIYRRFTEKSASSWRQIYKALQLLDYLVKNGSERVVDYARSHVAVIEVIRFFSYTDSKGVDRGVAIRHRADELIQLLNSTEKLRVERKKAKQLNAKTGVSAPMPGGGFGGSGRKYGGISSENFNTYKRSEFGDGVSANRVYGDGGGFDGSNDIVAASTGDEFEEYVVAPTESSGSRTKSYNTKSNTITTASKPNPAPAASTTAASTTAQTAADDDDEFDDFQSAPVVEPKSKNADILDLFNAPAPTPVPTSSINGNGSSSAAQPAPASSTSIPGLDASLFTTTTSTTTTPVSQQPISFAQPAPTTSTTGTTSTPAISAPVQPVAPKIDLFDSLWETSKSTTFSDPVPTPTKSTPITPSAPLPQPQTAPQPAANAQPAKQPQAANSQSDEIEDLLSF